LFHTATCQKFDGILATRSIVRENTKHKVIIQPTPLAAAV